MSPKNVGEAILFAGEIVAGGSTVERATTQVMRDGRVGQQFFPVLF
jgi:hypothetical protein